MHSLVALVCAWTGDQAHNRVAWGGALSTGAPWQAPVLLRVGPFSLPSSWLFSSEFQTHRLIKQGS